MNLRMRGYYCDGQNLSRRADLRSPTCQGDGVVVATTIALVQSASERHPDFRGVPGSQFIGVVVETGPAWTALRSRRVAVCPVVSCSACEFCRGGAPGVCPSRTVMGVHGCDGGMAEAAAVPGRNVVEVPARLTDEVAVHAWSAGRAARLVAAAMVSPSMYVTVLGDGAVAFLAAQLLTGRCEHVRLVSSEAWLIEECQRLGIRSRLGDEVGRRHDQHVVLDTTGRYADLASRMVRPKGVVVMGSSGAESQVLDVMEITSRDVTLTGCVGGSIAEGVGLLARGRVDVNGLLSATHDWSAGNLAGLSGAGILLRFSTFPSHAKAG